MKNLLFITIACFLFSTLATVSCDSLDSPEKKEKSLYTIYGELVPSSEDEIDVEHLRAAVIWFTGEKESTLDFPLEIKTNLDFEINFTQLPPVENLDSITNSFWGDTIPKCDDDSQDEACVFFRDFGNTQMALADMIIYEDANKNGQLDMLPLGTKNSIDRIVGTTRPYIIYIESDDDITVPSHEYIYNNDKVGIQEELTLPPGYGKRVEGYGSNPQSEANSGKLVIDLIIAPKSQLAMCDGKVTYSTSVEEVRFDEIQKEERTNFTNCAPATNDATVLTWTEYVFSGVCEEYEIQSVFAIVDNSEIDKFFPDGLDCGY